MNKWPKRFVLGCVNPASDRTQLGTNPLDPLGSDAIDENSLEENPKVVSRAPFLSVDRSTSQTFETLREIPRAVERARVKDGSHI